MKLHFENLRRAFGNSMKNVFSEENNPLFGSVVLLALLLLPFLGISNYTLHISVLVFVYVTLGLGLNIVVGLAGLLDLGYVAFYAVGAYTYALLSAHYPLPFPLALLVGAVLAAVLGITLGWPTIRARGDYLALVTLGFGEIIRLLMRNWDSVTNGPRGLMDVTPPHLFGITLTTPTDYYYLGLGMATLSLMLFWRVKHSSVGRQLAAVRDDEDVAIAIGINPVRWKLYAFAVGALLAGIAGVFFASWQRFVSPESFTLNESILILSIVVLGGIGRLWPTVGAAAFLVLLPEGLREFQNQRVLILGLMLVLAVITQEKLRLRRGRQRQQHPVISDEVGVTTHLTSSLAQLLPEVPPARTGRQSSEEVVLAITEVSKNFGGVVALDKVSLEVRRGEIVGLIGANGAGKTTLFRCVAGAERPDTGKIELCNGRSVRVDQLPPHQVPRRGIVRTFQHGGLIRSGRALENVQLGRGSHHVPSIWEPFKLLSSTSSNDNGFSEKLLNAIGGPPPMTAFGEMSPVDKKLTELARDLAMHPDVLLIDEPAASMDENARRRLVKALREVNQQWGTTLIVIEHDVDLLESLCNRLVVMENGRIIADGPTGDVLVNQAVQASYYAIGVDHETA